MNESPVVEQDTKQPTLSFAQAMEAVIDGQKVSKLEWADTEIYGQLKGGFLMIKLKNGWFNWIVAEADMVGNDWFVV